MKVALLMSGGVDSSYSAYLLKQAGYEVLGIYLKLHDKEKKHEIFIANCEKVAKNLNIDFMVIDAKKEFREVRDVQPKYEIWLSIAKSNRVRV